MATGKNPFPSMCQETWDRIPENIFHPRTHQLRTCQKSGKKFPNMTPARDPKQYSGGGRTDGRTDGPRADGRADGRTGGREQKMLILYCKYACLSSRPPFSCRRDESKCHQVYICPYQNECASSASTPEIAPHGLLKSRQNFSVQALFWELSLQF